MDSFIKEDYFIVRVPLLGVRNAYELLHKISASDDNDYFIGVMKELFADKLLQQAVFTASIDLYEQLVPWHAGKVADKKKEYKLAISLYKYFIRMCSRCTPFGLFAGVATGSFSSESNIKLNANSEHRFLSRPDMKCIAELIEHISARPGIREQLLYFPNNSIYRVEDKYRYVEYFLQNKMRFYNITSVDYSSYLEKILELSKNGCRIGQIACEVADEEVTEQECLEFVHELVASQILVSELEPTVTGEDYFYKLPEKLRKLEGTDALVARLEEVDHILKTEGDLVQRFNRVFVVISDIDNTISKTDLIQTDTFLSAPQITLKADSIQLLNRDVEKICYLSEVNSNPNLNNFKTAFLNRYEEKEMPLLEVLDTELGIGYGSGSNKDKDDAPLINDILVGGKNEKKFNYNSIARLRQKKINEALQQKVLSVKVTTEELEDLKHEHKEPVLPDSFFLLGNLLASSPEKIDEGDFRMNLTIIAGPSSPRLIGRFSYGDDLLHTMIDQSIEKEEVFEPDAVYAEIIHFPNARDANVVKRTNTRKYEIPYLGTSSLPADQQIPLSDLMVSVQGNKIMLRSKKLNKYVLPRLNSAHNHSRDGLPVYSFLGDLQFQGVNNTTFWDWGVFESQPFLPRIEYGRFILSRAKWNLFKKDYPALDDPKTDIKEYFKTIHESLSLPRYLLITKSDLELLIDVESLPGLQILREEFSKFGFITLTESLLDEANCFIQSPDGVHFNEIIIPYRRNGVRQPKYFSVTTHQQVPIPVQREFVPGSDWLYIKLYTGTKTAEKILSEKLWPFVKQLLSKSLIDKWFFLRFRDPDHHIRIRVHKAAGQDDFVSLVCTELNNILSDVLQSRQVWKVQLDTYVRELERYGYETITMSEAIFHHDSSAVAEFITMLEGAEGEKYRWLFALRGIDALLNDFGYTLDEKHNLLQLLHNAFFKEFGSGPGLARQLNDKYRENTKDIYATMNLKSSDPGDFEEALEVFEKRSNAIRKIVPSIKDALATANNGHTFNTLLESYIHMFLNRLFISNQRKHELVIYHHLAKYYESAKAIEKKKQKQV